MAVFPSGRGMLWCETEWFPRGGSSTLAKEVFERGSSRQVVIGIADFLSARGIPFPRIRSRKARKVISVWLFVQSTLRPQCGRVMRKRLSFEQ